jgi:predicted neuraminidase
MKNQPSIHLILLLLTLVFSVPTQAAPASELEAEFIFPQQDKHCHGSSLVECPNGDLLACWFYGSGERSADDVLIQGARKKKGDSQWSPVFLMADTPGFPDCNPVLYIDAKERLHLFWIAVLAHAWEHAILKTRIAEDYQGEGPPKWSWQDVILLDPGDEFAKRTEEVFNTLKPVESLWGTYAPKYTRLIIEAAKDPIKRETGWMTRIHPTTLPSGRILLPLYSDGFNICLMAISDDCGETWKASSPIVGMGPIQPTVARKKDGTLVGFFRDSGNAPGRALTSTSADDGMTWSPAVDTEILNPGSSLEVVVLADGRWVMAFNDTENGRHSLALSLSDDEGATWKWKRHLELANPGEGGFAYPSMLQARDGKIHTTYTYNMSEHKTIKHAALEAGWIVEGDGK